MKLREIRNLTEFELAESNFNFINNVDAVDVRITCQLCNSYAFITALGYMCMQAES